MGGPGVCVLHLGVFGVELSLEGRRERDSEGRERRGEGRREGETEGEKVCGMLLCLHLLAYTPSTEGEPASYKPLFTLQIGNLQRSVTLSHCQNMHVYLDVTSTEKFEYIYGLPCRG